MTLSWPFWLILIIPALVAFWLRPLPSRGLTLLRAVTVLLLLLAICGLSVNLPSRSGCVVVVADRSLSMPAGSQAQQVEAADLLYRSMGGGDELAVVSFGQRTSVEQPPQRTRFAGFVNDVGNEASNLAEGVDRAVSLIPRGKAPAASWSSRTAMQPGGTWPPPPRGRPARALPSTIVPCSAPERETWPSSGSMRRHRSRPPKPS